MLLKRMLETAPKGYNKKDLKEAYEEISAVVTSLNEEKRKRENHAKITLLTTKIKPEKPLDLGNNGKRIFMREAKVNEIEWTDYIHQV